MKRIGILGGTFNPIHLGHLITAEYCRVCLKLDEIMFIPTGNPPHKNYKEVLSTSLRYEMVSLAIKTNQYFSISDIEVSRMGNSYTYDTILELKESSNDVEYFFIIGFDTLKIIETWKNIDKVFEEITFIVVNRDNNAIELNKEIKNLKEKYYARILIVNIPNIGISSTDIRKLANKHASIKYLVPSEVEEFIDKNNLYR